MEEQNKDKIVNKLHHRDWKQSSEPALAYPIVYRKVLGVKISQKTV